MENCQTLMTSSYYIINARLIYIPTGAESIFSLLSPSDEKHVDEKSVYLAYNKNVWGPIDGIRKRVYKAGGDSHISLYG